MPEYIIKVTDEFVEQMKAKGMSDEYELIRCKDCKNPQFGIDVVYCEVVGRFINQNDYCSWAERKDDA